MVSKVVRWGLALILAGLLFAATAWGEAQKWGDTGTVSAVTVVSRTIVVEIPRGRDSMTVGAEVPPGAVLKADGRVIDLSEIKVGDRVRLEWSRGDQGDIAHAVIVLQPLTR